MIGFIGSAFVAGLVGSIHCIGMCGPFAVACGGRAGDTLLWHAGRLTTYTIMGVVAGAFGSMIPGPGWVGAVVGGILITWFAASLAGFVPEPHVSIPGVKHLATNLATRTNMAARFGFGMATGLLPCGLVYATLAVPVASGNPVVGGLAMAAFGLGTAPALTAVAMGLRKIVMRDMRLRRLLAAGVFLATLWSIGQRTGLVGTRHMRMHQGPGMDTVPEAQMDEHRHPSGAD
jgi:sulfite exporter TauE/SafE